MPPRIAFFERSQWDPAFNPKHFDCHDLILLIEIQYYSRMHLFGFNDLGLV